MFFFIACPLFLPRKPPGEICSWCAWCLVARRLGDFIRPWQQADGLCGTGNTSPQQPKHLCDDACYACSWARTHMLCLCSGQRQSIGLSTGSCHVLRGGLRLGAVWARCWLHEAGLQQPRPSACSSLTTSIDICYDGQRKRPQSAHPREVELR